MTRRKMQHCSAPVFEHGYLPKVVEGDGMTIACPPRHFPSRTIGDDEVLALWRQGKDTYDIAGTLQVPEHVIERRLHAALAVVRFSLNETSAAGAGRAGRLEPATRNSGAPAAPSLAREHLSG